MFYTRPVLIMLNFYTFLSLQTYNIDKQTADSASTASAMYTGVKTKYFTMGYDSSIDHYDVNSMTTARKVDGLLTWAQEAGKNTGEEIKIPARSPTLPMHLLFFMCVVAYELPIKYVICIIFAKRHDASKI